MVSYKWIILSSAWVAFFASCLVRFLVPSILPSLTVAFRMTGRDAGLLASMFWAGYSLFQLPSGFVADRQGARRALLIGTVLTTILEFVAAYSRDYTQLLIMQFLTGSTSAFIWPPGMLLMLNWFKPNERATASGFFNTAFPAGTAMSFFASAFMAENFGWNSPFFVYAGVLGLSAIATALFVSEKKSPKHAATLPQTLIRKTLTKKEIWFNASARFGLGFAYLGAAGWTTSYFVNTFHVPLIQAGLFGAWMTVIGIAGAPFGGLISDRLFQRRGPTIFIGLAGVGIILLVLASGIVTLFSEALVAFALLGLCQGFCAAPSSSIISEFKLENSAWGFAVSFINVMSQIGGAVSPALFGLFLDIFGSYSAGWLLFGSVALFFSLGPVLLIREGY